MFPRTYTVLRVALLAAACVPQSGAAEAGSPLKVIQVKDPGGQVLSYRHLASSAEIRLRGTRLAPDARINLKIGSRPGFVELDINRGGIHGLRPASQFGKDFLTYVLWAVSIDGRASNLGEITFNGNDPVSINVTTPYQTFWLMVTAEPDYAVVEPSSHVVLYSIGEGGGNDGDKPMPLPGNLFYFTHYSDYESSPVTLPDRVPNQLLQARKAVELAEEATAKGESGHLEGQYTQAALKQAHDFLARAEAAFQKDAKGREVIQFARTSAQTAESARALARGAVGGVGTRELENELAELKGELAKLRGAPPPVKPKEKEYSVTVQTESLPKEQKPPAPAPPERFAELKKPTLWVAVLGWAVALVLLFRRRAF